MDFQAAIRLAASGMSAQRLRLNLISSNLANAQTTRSATGGPYQRRDAVFQSENPTDTFENVLSEMEEDHMRGVKVPQIMKSDRVREMYDPHHPDANEEGIVRYPDINVVEEMVDMLQATRSYEANVQAVKALKSMALQALNIGG